VDDLKVICWKWKPPEGYRSAFGPLQVNTFRNMVERHYHKPHEVVCITDDPTGLDPRIRTISIWDEFKDLQSPHGGTNPACYRRLKMYDPNFGSILGGDRFVSVDLDVVIVDDVTPVWDRPDVDFMIWGETLRRTPYNGSMQMMTAGARPKVYTDFDPVESPKIARKAGMDGSDQAWISYALGPEEKRWNTADGVHSFRLHVRSQGGKVPKGGRIIFFEGHIDPWSPAGRTHAPGVVEHWR
jgi:hypothetical protein